MARPCPALQTLSREFLEPQKETIPGLAAGQNYPYETTRRPKGGHHGRKRKSCGTYGCQTGLATDTGAIPAAGPEKSPLAIVQHPYPVCPFMGGDGRQPERVSKCVASLRAAAGSRRAAGPDLHFLSRLLPPVLFRLPPDEHHFRAPLWGIDLYTPTRAGAGPTVSTTTR